MKQYNKPRKSCYRLCKFWSSLAFTF